MMRDLPSVPAEAETPFPRDPAVDDLAPDWERLGAQWADQSRRLDHRIAAFTIALVGAGTLLLVADAIIRGIIGCAQAGSCPW